MRKRGTAITYLQFRLRSHFFDSERPVFHVRLHSALVELPADQTFRIKHRVGRVDGHLT